MENEKLIEEAKATQNATDLAHGLWDNLAEANFRISELEAALAAAMEREKVMREVCEQGQERCENYLRGLLAPSTGPVIEAFATMVISIQNDFKEALGFDFAAAPSQPEKP